jgi:lysine 6-dehydrogenase
MKYVVLGASGIQGRTVLHDLASDNEVSEVICADIQFDELTKIEKFTNMDKIKTAKVDATDIGALAKLFKEADAVVDLLPSVFTDNATLAAIQAKVSIVSTNYEYHPEKFDEDAKRAGVAIMPECGLDPGIDLVTYGHAASKFDELHSIKAYCGGFPEKSACDNPLNYKISWTWRGVLNSTLREGRIIKDKKVIDIPAMNQHDEAFVHTIDFPGLGELEAIPNGNSVYFTDLMGLSDTILETGRYALRWPGWSAFWRPLKEFGFLSEEPVNGFDCNVTPIDFLDKFLGPQLEYKADEKDLVAMVNIFEGLKDNKKIRFTSTMLIERDLDTGITAMSQGVGYTAAIVARMLAKQTIKEKGMLSPLKHVPAEEFMNQLKKRGIIIQEKTTILED